MYSNELIYLLDLCIFAYHLHSQTLIWPMDPYYEQVKGDPIFGSRRNNFKTEVHNSANTFQGITDGNGTPIYHGPGGFFGTPANGWISNRTLDPIIADYSRINPFLPSFTRPEPGQWILYNTPKEIVSRIETVQYARYSEMSDPIVAPVVDLVSIPFVNLHHSGDWLYCFEGGTGAIGAGAGNANPTLPSWSMMGFVLVEDTGNNNEYNVYIAFRGSRSGSGMRAIFQGIRDKGNPDWATDLDFKNRVEDLDISFSGACARGFRTSINTMFPAILKCLTDIQQNKNRAPNKIFVTGHSLGGALATLFSSAMTCGDKYGFYATPNRLPAPLQGWPWKDLTLVTFGAPPSGDGKFSLVINSLIPTIRRCLLVERNGDNVTRDPITDIHNSLMATFLWKTKRRTSDSKLEARVVGRHVGTPIEIDLDRTSRFKGSQTQNTHLHEPANTRRGLIKYMESLNASLAGIPAVNNSGVNDEEPYMEFKSFEDLIDHLDQNINLSAIEISEIFINFKKSLGLYIDIFSTLVDQSIRSKFTSILNYCNNPGTKTAVELRTFWQETDILAGKTRMDIYKFIGLCLLMCGVSEGIQTYRNMIADPAYSQKRPFK